MAKYPDYDSLPAHIKEMLRLVTTGEDGGAERYANAPNKHLGGKSVLEVANRWFGRRLVEQFLVEMGSFLGVDEMERFEARYGRRR